MMEDDGDYAYDNWKDQQLEDKADIISNLKAAKKEIDAILQTRGVTLDTLPDGEIVVQELHDVLGEFYIQSDPLINVPF